MRISRVEQSVLHYSVSVRVAGISKAGEQLEKAENFPLCPRTRKKRAIGVVLWRDVAETGLGHRLDPDVSGTESSLRGLLRAVT